MLSTQDNPMETIFGYKGLGCRTVEGAWHSLHFPLLSFVA